MHLTELLTFEPGSGFEEGFLQRAVQVEVQPLELGDVVSDPGQQHQIVEALSHSLLQIRREDPARTAQVSENRKRHRHMRSGPCTVTSDLVAWYMAAAVHVSGSVRYSTCSQLERAGMILKALGSFPLRYFDRTWRGRVLAPAEDDSHAKALILALAPC